MLDRFYAENAISVIGSLLFLVAAWFIAAWVERLVRRSLEKRKQVDASFIPFLARTARVAIILVALFVALDELGVEVASIIAAFGVFGFAIGLALRGTLSNIFTGIAVFSLKPYEAGDEIVADRVGGVVEKVGLFHTVVVSEGSYLSLPNTMVWARNLRNLSRPRPWQVDLDVSIEKGPSFAEVERLAIASMTAFANVVPEPDPRVRVLDVTQSTMVLRASAWCAAEFSWDVRAGLIGKLREDLTAAGVTVNLIEEPAKPADKSGPKKPAAKAPTAGAKRKNATRNPASRSRTSIFRDRRRKTRSWGRRSRRR